jgi:hypothetical protein
MMIRNVLNTHDIWADNWVQRKRESFEFLAYGWVARTRALIDSKLFLEFLENMSLVKL